jgi:transporter family protein
MSIEAWFLPSMTALVFNGIVTFLPKITMRSLPILDLIVYHTLFFFLTAAGIQVFFGGIGFEPVGVMIAMASGVAGTTGQFLYLLALKRGPLTQVSMISALFPLVATLLAVAFLQEVLTPRQGIGILLGVGAIILLVLSRAAPVTINQTTGQAEPAAYGNWALPALGTLLAWGIWAFIPKMALNTMTPQSTLFYAAIGDILVVLPIFFFVLRCRLHTDRKSIGITFAASTMTMLSMLAYFFALSHGPVAVIATLSAMYPAITVLLARVFLKEKINRSQFIAICIALAAIVLLAG